MRSSVGSETARKVAKIDEARLARPGGAILRRHRAKAYNQSPEAVAFYEFTRTMQSYKSMIAENTTLVLSTSSDLFKFLKGMTPDGDVVPAPRSVGNR
jgi:regulator of protease activity HflC (stomatin/prohibitin superfamily)